MTAYTEALREQTAETIARVDRLLAEPRDPEVVARAEHALRDFHATRSRASAAAVQPAAAVRGVPPAAGDLERLHRRFDNTEKAIADFVFSREHALRLRAAEAERRIAELEARLAVLEGR